MEWLTTTSILIAINMLVFAATWLYTFHITSFQKFLNSPLFTIDPEVLLKWGGDYGPLTLTGQFWRVLTSAFLHAGLMHLLMNMLFLWRFGTVLDRILSRAQAFAIYLLTGSAASLFSLIWHPAVNSVGASGAIFGQAGVLLMLFALGEHEFLRKKKSLLIWIGFLGPFGLLPGSSKGVDYAAHVGGLLSGVLIGAMFALTSSMPAPERASRQRRILTLATLVLVVMFAALTQARRNAVLEYSLRPGSQNLNDNPQAQYSLGIRMLRGDGVAKNEAEAIKLLQKSADAGYPPALLQLGWMTQHGQSGEKNEAKAVEYYKKAIAQDSRYHLAYNDLAWLYLTTDDPKLRNPQKALPLAQKAVALSDSRDGHELDTLAHAYFQLGNLDEAVKAETSAAALEPDDDFIQKTLKAYQDAKGNQLAK